MSRHEIGAFPRLNRIPISLEGELRHIAAYCVAALGLASCASTPPQKSSPALPFDVGNGVGSQFGNYEMRPAGETHDAAGNRCVTFNWDRPLNRDFAIRYTSESCSSKEHPDWRTATPYVRTVIPISQSYLSGYQATTAPENSN
jgi:hypothetical protein